MQRKREQVKGELRTLLQIKCRGRNGPFIKRVIDCLGLETETSYPFLDSLYDHLDFLSNSQARSEGKFEKEQLAEFLKWVRLERKEKAP